MKMPSVTLRLPVVSQPGAAHITSRPTTEPETEAVTKPKQGQQEVLDRVVSDNNF